MPHTLLLLSGGRLSLATARDPRKVVHLHSQTVPDVRIPQRVLELQQLERELDDEPVVVARSIPLTSPIRRSR